MLVTGAGQGLIVDHLVRRGFEAVGIDLDPRMVAIGRSRRRIDLLLGDALHLPARSRSFRTVIVSSGVLDYTGDEDFIGGVIAESLRVLVPYGHLLVAFYALKPELERIYRRLGILVGDTYHSGRSADVHRTLERSPIECARKIASWTGKSHARSLAYFTWLGISRPRVLADEDRVIEAILDRARKDGLSPDVLYDSMPGSVPYRDVPAVRSLLGRVGLPGADTTRHEDCIVAIHRKTLGTASRAGGRASAAGAPAPRARSGWILRAEGLVKSYGRTRPRAVDSLDLTVERGRILGLLGPNGAGKTTTISMICGLIRPDGGRIVLDPSLGRGIQAAIGLVPQELAVYPALTGRENLEFFGRLQGMSGRDLAARIDALLSLVGLSDRAGDPVKAYSTGMARRLNLAAGLVHDPPLLLLDEPTVGIDPQSRNCIYDAVLEARSRGTAVIHTTHYMDEAARLCDSVAIMDSGRVILEGPPATLVERHGISRIELDESGGGPWLAEEIGALDQVLGTASGHGTVTVFLSGAARSMETVEAACRIAEKRGARLELRSVIRPDLASLVLDGAGRGLEDGAETGGRRVGGGASCRPGPSRSRRRSSCSGIPAASCFSSSYRRSSCSCCRSRCRAPSPPPSTGTPCVSCSWTTTAGTWHAGSIASSTARAPSTS